MCDLCHCKSTDTVWFVQIIGEFDSPENVIDDYGHSASAGEKYMLGHFYSKFMTKSPGQNTN